MGINIVHKYIDLCFREKFTIAKQRTSLLLRTFVYGLKLARSNVTNVVSNNYWSTSVRVMLSTSNFRCSWLNYIEISECWSTNFTCTRSIKFFEFVLPEEVQSLFQTAGFIEEQIHVDRRLQVNRGKLLKMYRVWLQAKYKKPLRT